MRVWVHLWMAVNVRVLHVYVKVCVYYYHVCAWLSACVVACVFVCVLVYRCMYVCMYACVCVCVRVIEVSMCVN